MGKTKTKIMDDSQIVEEKPKRKLGRQDELVEKLKAELGVSDSVDQQVSESESQKKEEKAEERKTDTLTHRPTEKPKQGKAKPRSKKYQEASKDLDKNKTYPLNEAVDLVKKLSYSKFNATLEAHINTAQANLRGLVSLPFASGKKLRILAFGPSTTLGVNPLQKLEAESGVIFGDDSTIEEINKGKVNFDLVVTTPEWMPKLAKIARILGPRGLMPNPKNGTITTDLKKAIEGFQAGKTEYKTESKAAVIHLGLGKLNQPTEELTANITTLLQTLGKSRVKKVTLSPTMGPSVKLDLASL